MPSTRLPGCLGGEGRASLLRSAIQRYESTLNNAVRDGLGSLLLREVTNSTLRQFLQGLADRGNLTEALAARVVIRGVPEHAIHDGAPIRG